MSGIFFERAKKGFGKTFLYIIIYAYIYQIARIEIIPYDKK